MSETKAKRPDYVGEPELSSEEVRCVIIDRDAFTCRMCGCDVDKRMFEPGATANIHHIIPVSNGGETIPGNLVTLCGGCHRRLHRDGLDTESFDVSGKDWMHHNVLLTDSMVEMLDWFAEQPCSCATIGHISDATGWSRETVRSNLKQLRAGDYAERRYSPTGEYRLIGDPRNDHEH